MSPSLPFLSTAQVLEQGGEVVGEIDCSVWAIGDARDTGRGGVYDYTGEADLGAAELIIPTRNRSLVVDGVTLKLVSARRAELLPHVSMRLLFARQGGG